ncbi:aminopeptidase P family protein [bacterium]|nr:aminopeptidase P family protein [bacterium]
MTVLSKLESIRKVMVERDLNAWIIPSSDPHQSEYVANRWQGRAWASGFTGSAGTLVITEKEAGLWTDGRYFLQAEEELKGSSITLFKMFEEDVPTVEKWLSTTLNKGDIVGLDGLTTSLKSFESMEEELDKKGVSLRSESDILDTVWSDRPDFPDSQCEPFPLEYAGRARIEKFKALRKSMKEEKIDIHLFASLDDIAWLFNIRGTDVHCNPVIISYAMVTHDDVILFIDTAKMPDSMRATLEEDGVILREYDAIFSEISEIESGKKLLIDPQRTSIALVAKIPKDTVTIKKENMTQLSKAVKNEDESAGMRKAHHIDGIAITRFLCWLETAVKTEQMTEVDAANRLAEFRKLGADYEGPSFDTISGYAGNGAIIHYTAEEKTAATLKPEGLYLVDSGGQYAFGTTDITRTIALGPVTERMKRDFTLVLKGHIALASTRFPKNVSGTHLDILARKSLWDFGLNYAHGTGHGIGVKLNVHEGPHGISPRWIETRLQPGMMISNEPGFYLAGQYGIRIESIVEVVKDKEFENFFCFDTITVCPIDRRLVDQDIMTDDDKIWLTNYNLWCVEMLSPHLNDKENEWLTMVCEPLL